VTSTTPVTGLPTPGGDLPAALRAHWQQWLGADQRDLSRLGTRGGPDGPGPSVTVVGSRRRDEPGWDGEAHPVAGVVDPRGAAVVSVPERHARWARQLVADGGGLEDLRATLPARLGAPDGHVYQAVYRWAVPPVPDLPDAGAWVPVDDPRVPEWLRPFGGEALLALDDRGRYLAGVGLKRHDDRVHEIAVGTEDAARGRGLARRLVAQAARELLVRGVTPTYMHDPANAPSARVADAAGFPDRGWTALGFVREVAPQK
jgi:GNAT superfamily N-acetyltransferase